MSDNFAANFAMSTITENIAGVRRRIERAASKTGRDPGGIRLVAVTKAVDTRAAAEAIDAGVTALGESRVQEARRKFETLGGRAEWHMIGPLQTNKAKYCPGLFSLIHSLDRLDLGRELSRRAEAAGAVMECLLQVNVAGEEKKSGCNPREAAGLVKELAGLSGIRITGLMAIPPFGQDPEASRPYYRALFEVRDGIERLGLDGVTMREMSMGMTGDFEVAVEEGATLVRVGTAVFGKRVYR